MLEFEELADRSNPCERGPKISHVLRSTVTSLIRNPRIQKPVDIEFKKHCEEANLRAAQIGDMLAMRYIA